MTFSKRHNFAVMEPPITIREDAPAGLRYAAIINAVYCGLSYSQIRNVVCKVLLTAPDESNWSEIPNIRDEVMWAVNNCEWFKVYDIIEALVSFIERTYGYQGKAEYVNSMNTHFVDADIGWKYEAGEGIIYRGENSFQTATKTTSQLLEETGYQRASREISEAIADISRRPHPDVTGAISHATAAIECVGNKILGTEKTLGQITRNLDLPKPLDQALEKLWGYASNEARHGKETANPTTEEAELIVHISCAICSFLAKKDSAG